MAIVQENNGQHTVCIPKQYVRLLGWAKGTELVVVPQDKAILLKEMPQK